MEAGFRRLIFEIDCLKLFSQLRNGEGDRSTIGMIVRDICALARKSESMSFSFARRMGNKVAQDLASLSKSYNGILVWLEEVPQAIYLDVSLKK